MSYSIIRVSKIKGSTNTRGIQRHVQRENKNYENDDIDLSKTHLNYDLINDKAVDFNKQIEEKIEMNYKAQRKIRSDAVKHVNGVITSDSEFFENKSQDEIKNFFKYTKSFLEDEYGKDNLLYATVHMDEKTPHMHYGIVPITEDGRLSAKDVVGNKKALTEFQDRFNTYINHQGYELERGTPKNKTNAKHAEVEKYKQETSFHQKQLEKNKQESEIFSKRRGDLSKEVKTIYNQKREIQRDNQMLIDQIEKLKEEKDAEKAKRDDIRAKREKEERTYQKMIKSLNEPVNIEYEYEYKKTSIFSSDRYKTDNVIISKEILDKLDEQAKNGRRIASEYDSLRTGKKHVEQQEVIKQQQAEILEKNEKMQIARENYRKYQEEIDNTKARENKTKKIINEACGHIKNWIGEKNYHRGIDFVDTKMERNQMIREIMTVDDNDANYFYKKDIKIRQMEFERNKRAKDNKMRNRGFDLDK